MLPCIYTLFISDRFSISYVNLLSKDNFLPVEYRAQLKAAIAINFFCEPHIIHETFSSVCSLLSFSDGPVVVKVGFWILSIEKIDVVNMVCCTPTDDLIVYF